MEPELEDIHARQRLVSNDYSSEQKRRDHWTATCLKPIEDATIEKLNVGHGEVMLDVVAGTGQGNDFPFPDGTFDAVRCQLGFMFFHDMLATAREIYRMVKPGGRIVATVWGSPERNVWATGIIGAVLRNLELPLPRPGEPGIFRCAIPGTLVDILTRAGFRNAQEITLHEERVDIEALRFFWDYMNDVSVPITAAMCNADPELRKKIKREVFQELAQLICADGMPRLEWEALLITGEK